MMQCIAYATADQYHLPTLCHDLIANGFSEIKEFPRGQFIFITFFMFLSWHKKKECIACLFVRSLLFVVNKEMLWVSDASNVLAMGTENAAKTNDSGTIFFFRYNVEWFFFLSLEFLGFDFGFVVIFCAVYHFREGSVVFWNVEEKTVSINSTHTLKQWQMCW